LSADIRKTRRLPTDWQQHGRCRLFLAGVGGRVLHIPNPKGENPMAKKILIAIDDSENAQRAAAFVAQTFTPDSRITLFSVVPDTATICEMDSPELTPYFVTQQSSFCTIEAKKRELIENALTHAKNDLLAAGFAAEALKTKVEAKKKGIAQDIAAEAQTGYDVVVLGRRGISGIKEFFLGSISQKVINAVKDVSVVFVN